MQKDVVEGLLASLVHDKDFPIDPNDIVVLTPFRAHRRLIARNIENSNWNLSGVRARTVATFQVLVHMKGRKVQGCESPVVIVSVGTHNLNTGFLTERLVNVMTSRQMFELFIVTDLHVSSNFVW